ncbi:MAG TPA: DsbA family protein [Verrucomicrobiae bacterium]|nr:DsbA family protein [Verrucomicrobiae bacterium]
MRTSWQARLSLPVGERDHIQGPATAAITLVEYGDYECPYCGQAYPIVKQLQKRLGKRLRFVFRNFPLSTMHPHAEHAAEAAETGGAHGRFWEMHDVLYENQKTLDDDALVEYALAVGLDATKFATDMAGHTLAARVREDFLSGVRSGVNGTPTFFINGVRHDDSFDLETLLNAMEQSS